MSKTELPPGWVSVRLEEIAEVRLGRQRSPKNHSGEQMRPYLRAGNVDWKGLKLDDVKEMNFTDAEVETYRLLPGDIVLGEASGSPREVGKPALWNGQIDDCCFQNTLIRVRPEPGIEPRYLLLLLRYEALSGSFAQGARGVGIHHLGSAKLASWPIPLPPISEQQRIVEAVEDHLSRLDAADGALAHAKLLTPLQVRSLFTAATEGRVAHAISESIPDFRECRRALWKKARGEKKYNPPVVADLSVAPTVPDGWSVFSLEELTDPIRTIRYGILMPKVKEGGVVPYVEVKDLAGCTLRETGLHLTSRELDEKFAGARIHPGDLVLAVRGSYDRSAVVPSSIESANVSRDVARIAPLPGLDVEYLHLYFQSKFAQNYLENHARGVAVKGVNIASIRSMPVVVPPLSSQRAIVEYVQEKQTVVEAAGAAVVRSIRRSGALRQAVLSKAFSGHLVAQNAGDEHASLVVERIRAERDTRKEASGGARSRRRRRPSDLSPALAPVLSSATSFSPYNAVQQEFEF
ncbi:restriction endonuclease subunit S [Streptomyces sp. NPDC055808]